MDSRRKTPRPAKQKEFDNKVQESSKTKQRRRRYGQQNRRNPSADARNDDSSNPHTNEECRDGPRAAYSRNRPVSSCTESESQGGESDNSNMSYWTSLSIRAAMAVIKANGSEKVGKRAANAVLEAGKKNHLLSSMDTLATKVSVIVLEAGGDQEAAAAVTKAIMNGGQNVASRKAKLSSQTSKPIKDVKGNIRVKEMPKSPSSKTSVASVTHSITAKRRMGNNRVKEMPKSLSSKTSVASATPSMTAKRRVLKEKEDEITRKMKALDEAELLNLQRETDLERMTANAKMINARVTGHINSTNANEEKSLSGSIKNDASYASRTSGDACLDSPSVKAKWRELKEKEDKIAKMMCALEEAEQSNELKEKELSERMVTEKQLGQFNGRTRGHCVGVFEEDRSRTESLPTVNEAQKSDESTKSLKETKIIKNDLSFSSTPSMKAKQRQLKERQDEITRKNKALAEVALVQQKREMEMSERNLQLDKEMSERLSALDATEVSLQERTKNVQLEAKRRNERLKLDQRERDIKERMAALDAAEAALMEGGTKKQVHFDCDANRVEVKLALGSGCDGSVATSGSESEESTHCSSSVKSPQQPQSDNKYTFGELTGRLYSIFDAAMWAGLAKDQASNTSSRASTPSTAWTHQMLQLPQMPTRTHQTPQLPQMSTKTHQSPQQSQVPTRTHQTPQLPPMPSRTHQTPQLPPMPTRTHQTPQLPPMPAAAPEAMDNGWLSYKSFSTQASASTGIITNKTGDVSRATGITGISALTDDQGAWEFPTLREDTGRKHPGYHVPWQDQGQESHVSWKHQKNVQGQNNVASTQIQNDHATTNLLNQALHAALSQYTDQTADAPKSSVESLKSVDQSSREQPSNDQASTFRQQSVTTASSRSSSHSKRRMNFFSFSKKKPVIGRKSAGSKQKFLI